MGLGCTFGCARQVVFREAMLQMFYLYDDGMTEGKSTSIPANGATYYAAAARYWAVQVVLLSLEKIFNTYADFQVIEISFDTRPQLSTASSDSSF
jgi:hypothetical protein